MPLFENMMIQHVRKFPQAEEACIACIGKAAKPPAQGQSQVFTLNACHRTGRRAQAVECR